jgi:hypothetical protein
MYLIIKKVNWGSAGLSFSVASHSVSRDEAIRKLLALDTLNDDKKKTTYHLWSDANGDLTNTETKPNGAEQEAGQNVEK